MKTRKKLSTNARKKQLKVQHHKINSRRQFYFNQMITESVQLQSKEQ